MMRRWYWLALGLCVLAPLAGALHSAPEARSERHRSPLDLAVLADGRRVLTANHTADSASLVDLEHGRVLAEHACGHRPAGAACSADGRRAAVSNLWSGTVTLLAIEGDTLRSAGEVAVGSLPRGLVFAPDGGSVYVAVGGGNEVVQLDWTSRSVVRRWPAPAEPRRLALSRDGRVLAAVSARSAQVRCWDTSTGRQLWERTVVGAFNLHGLAFDPTGTELVAAHAHDRHHPIAVHNIREGWAIDNRLTRLTVQPDAKVEYWQLALDTRGLAVADPCAAAFSAEGAWLAVAAAGTHEVLVFQARHLPWCSGDPGDFLDALLDRDDGKLRRVPVGGRPVAVQFLGARAEVAVANYLLDAVQVLDAATGQVLRQVPLGSPATPSLARQGEAIFHDAKRSFHQWFSCHTCHPDGHTCGRNFDTLNDDSYGNPKMTPTLRGVGRTGPWTWHGWQDQLGHAVEKSLTETLFGPTKPSAHDVQAVVAFLETLDHPPAPPAAPASPQHAARQRGQALFTGKARCARCHQGTDYTAAKNYDVKLEPDGSPFEAWNPPSLRGLFDRGPYFHDGRAETLDELLRVHHVPEKLGGAALTPEERRDLVEFLLSL